MSGKGVPERLRWAAATLAVAPSDRVLEIGCGSGVAVSLICDHLVHGSMAAVDRSAKQIELATQRNREHVSAGKVAFHVAPLDTLDLGDERFDKVFAVNVNVFWTQEAHQELDRVATHLATDGRLYLFYEPPDRSQLEETAAKVSTTLRKNDFAIHGLKSETVDSRPQLCIEAAPARA